MRGVSAHHRSGFRKQLHGMRVQNVSAGHQNTKNKDVTPYLTPYRNPPEVADIFSAGLDIELLSGDAREIVAHVMHCEWARYYLEHHASVGYLLACSTHDPMYRLQCDEVRFQRRCTLMEGGDYCEFCFYRL